MDKQTLYKRIYEGNENRIMITKRKLAKALGIGQCRAEKILNDLTPLYNKSAKGGHAAKLYFIDDICDEIMRKGM